jgi:hypothetical protein
MRLKTSAVDKEAGEATITLDDLWPGRRSKREPALIESTFELVANYKIMGTFVDAARLIRSDVDMPLIARWECQSRTDGLDSWFSAVPIPVDQHHPLYARLRALQNQHMPIPEASTDDPRDLPIDAALPIASMHYTFYTTTEVLWWSPSVVSLLDWGSSYSGGAHTNLGFESHTWIRSPDGQWRDADLADLFGKRGPWHRQIVDAVTKDLIRQGAGEYIDAEHTVARPTAEKLLKTWNIAGDGLVISFATYEVGSYSQGPFQVRVPWAKLPPLTADFPADDVRGRP